MSLGNTPIAAFVVLVAGMASQVALAQSTLQRLSELRGPEREKILLAGARGEGPLML